MAYNDCCFSQTSSSYQNFQSCQQRNKIIQQKPYNIILFVMCIHRNRINKRLSTEHNLGFVLYFQYSQTFLSIVNFPRYPEITLSYRWNSKYKSCLQCTKYSSYDQTLLNISISYSIFQCFILVGIEPHLAEVWYQANGFRNYQI